MVSPINRVYHTAQGAFLGMVYFVCSFIGEHLLDKFYAFLGQYNAVILMVRHNLFGKIFNSIRKSTIGIVSFQFGNLCILSHFNVIFGKVNDNIWQYQILDEAINISFVMLSRIESQKNMLSIDDCLKIMDMFGYYIQKKPLPTKERIRVLAKELL